MSSFATLILGRDRSFGPVPSPSRWVRYGGAVFTSPVAIPCEQAGRVDLPIRAEPLRIGAVLWREGPLDRIAETLAGFLRRMTLALAALVLPAGFARGASPPAKGLG